MPVHVRVRDGQALRRRVEAVGSQADVAMRAGLSPARLSQIISGTAPRIKVQDAARLEKVLGVPPRTFFEFDGPDAELVAAYLALDAPEPAGVPEPAEDRAVPVECGEG